MNNALDIEGKIHVMGLWEFALHFHFDVIHIFSQNFQAILLNDEKY